MRGRSLEKCASSSLAHVRLSSSIVRCTSLSLPRPQILFLYPRTPLCTLIWLFTCVGWEGWHVLGTWEVFSPLLLFAIQCGISETEWRGGQTGCENLRGCPVTIESLCLLYDLGTWTSAPLDIGSALEILPSHFCISPPIHPLGKSSWS